MCPSTEDFQTFEIGQNIGRGGALGIADAQVHRAMTAQGGKARVHFGGENAGNGAVLWGAGPKVRFGVARSEFFGDGDGFGHDHAVGRAHSGGGFGGVKLLEKIGKFIALKAGGVQFDGDVEGIEQQPSAQAPTGIGAVADHEVIGHCRLRVWVGRRLGDARARWKAVICAWVHHGN